MSKKVKRKNADIVKRYISRGVEYEQRKIVLEQFYRILKVIGIDPGKDASDQEPLTNLHVNEIPLILAIILNEPGQPPCGEDEQEARAKKLACIIDLKTQTRMIEDFIALNDFALIGKQMREIGRAFGGALAFEADKVLLN